MNDEPLFLRLARYLKEFSALRTTKVHDLERYEKDGSVIWFGEIPQEEDCVSPAWIDGDQPTDRWLTVKQQEFQRCPPLPEELIPWVDSALIRKASGNPPQLNSTAYVSSDDPEEDSPRQGGHKPAFAEFRR